MSQMRSFFNQFWRVLLNRFQDDSHVIFLLVAGDDDGFVEMVVFIFRENQSNIFSFVGWDAFFVDEDAGVEAVWLALEDDGAVRFFVDASFKFAFYGFEAEFCDSRFWVILIEFHADFSIKIVKIFVA